ncbi:hypothetical protein ACOMHN_029657 [Nucella lapillus]
MLHGAGNPAVRPVLCKLVLAASGQNLCATSRVMLLARDTCDMALQGIAMDVAVPVAPAWDQAKARAIPCKTCPMDKEPSYGSMKAKLETLLVNQYLRCEGSIPWPCLPTSRSVRTPTTVATILDQPVNLMLGFCDSSSAAVPDHVYQK